MILRAILCVNILCKLNKILPDDLMRGSYVSKINLKLRSYVNLTRFYKICI